jgi:phage terminase large subunit GpA-like protein
MSNSSQLIEAFCDALRRPQVQTVSQWAEANRVLTAEESARPGPWRNSETPYLVGIMDATHRRGVEEVTHLKPTQVGGSELLRNITGHAIDCEPGPMQWNLADEESLKDMFDESLMPLIQNTESLKKKMTDRRWDMKRGRLRLRGMSIYGAWSGSAMKMARRPIRYLFNDELDKWKSWTGKEANPVKLARERTKTYGSRKRVYNTSTPTIESGYIWQAWLSCDLHFHYYIPCPHCGTYQRLIFPQVKWPKGMAAGQVKATRAAWYECVKCKGEITDSSKQALLQAGRWINENQTIQLTGTVDEPDTPNIFAKPWGMQEWVFRGRRYRVVGDDPPVAKIGFQISTLYSPSSWVTFSDVAAEFLASKDYPELLQNFTNSWLAEIYKPVVHSTVASVLKEKEKIKVPALTIPDWALCLIATADTQKDCFYWVVRAWGENYKSQRVDHGQSKSFEDLRMECLNMGFKGSSGLDEYPALMLIDSGGTRDKETDESRTAQVYQFAQSDPTRIIAIKGVRPRPGSVWRIKSAKIDPNSKRPDDIKLYLLNTEVFKDTLAQFISEKPGGFGEWLLNDEQDEEYLQQMSSEHKVVVDRRTGFTAWQKVTTGAANHYWDCEYMQIAGADIVDLRSAHEIISSPDQSAVGTGTVGKMRPGTVRGEQHGWLDGTGNWWSK